MNIAKNKISQAMLLPGFEDWRSPVDVPHLHRPLTRPDELPGQGRVAAVMLLVYPARESNDGVSDSQVDEGFDLSLVLTKRNAGLSNHAGQISFPGGRMEEGESLWETACRETFEEIGVGSANRKSGANEIELLGQLNPIYIPPSDFTVSPFVGWHQSRPQFTCALQEVEEVIEAGLSHLLDPASLKSGSVVSTNGEHLKVPFYQVGEHQVWGATAIMLSELLERVARI